MSIACWERAEMLTDMARVLVRFGIALLTLALLARLGDLSAANQIGDDLALLTSGATIILGAGYLRFGRRH